jgi:hypothetical protein
MTDEELEKLAEKFTIEVEKDILYLGSIQLKIREKFVKYVKEILKNSPLL